MKESDIKSVCQKAIDYFGTSRLVDQTIEEMGMMSATLMMFKHGTVDDETVVNRLATTVLELYQLSLIFNIDEVTDKMGEHIKKLVDKLPKQQEPKPEVNWYYGD